ncbi:MAG: pyrimidine 5'-nucleotidase, partial [Hafnia sp.]
WSQRLGVTANHINEAFLQAMADICDVLPGARELINALSGKANLGIITNGFTQLQTIRLERTGMKDAFSTLVISEQVGIAKPDVGIFEYAFSLMNNPPKERILMVGDNPHSDILGGINAGIDTCWVNSAGSDLPEGISPSYQVSSLSELQKILLA